jgi:uncharacterized protein (TIGR02996 family)
MLSDEPFLRAICEDPEDDSPRLIYADFLEESGDPVRAARAEFIRLQCALARQPDDPRRGEWQKREAALLSAYSRAWNGPVHRRLRAGPLGGQVRARRGLIRGWRYRRGFIAEVTAHVSVVLEHPDELTALGPLERLSVLMTRGRLAELLASPLMARIRELGLSRNGLTGADLPLLFASPLVSRLRWLDLRKNPMLAADRDLLRAAVRDGRLPAQTLFDEPSALQVRQPARPAVVLPTPAAPAPEPSGTPRPGGVIDWLRGLWRRQE